MCSSYIQEKSFVAALNITLGTAIGLMVSYPISIRYDGILRLSLVFLLAILGGIIGFRRRESRLFLYFSLLVVLILGTIIFLNLL